MDELDQFAKELRAAGFTIGIHLEDDGEWALWIGRDNWWTNDLYNTQELPHWKGPVLKDVIAYTKFWLKQYLDRKPYKFNTDNNA